MPHRVVSFVGHQEAGRRFSTAKTLKNSRDCMHGTQSSREKTSIELSGKRQIRVGLVCGSCLDD